MNGAEPSRRSDDQPTWKLWLKVGTAVLALVGAGFTAGLVWGPLAGLPTAASTARGEREEMKRDIRTHSRMLCEVRSYQTWTVCMAVYDGGSVACDREYRSALQECQQ